MMMTMLPFVLCVTKSIVSRSLPEYVSTRIWKNSALIKVRKRMERLFASQI